MATALTDPLSTALAFVSGAHPSTETPHEKQLLTETNPTLGYAFAPSPGGEACWVLATMRLSHVTNHNATNPSAIFPQRCQSPECDRSQFWEAHTGSQNLGKTPPDQNRSHSQAVERGGLQSLMNALLLHPSWLFAPSRIFSVQHEQLSWLEFLDLTMLSWKVASVRSLGSLQRSQTQETSPMETKETALSGLARSSVDCLRLHGLNPSPPPEKMSVTLDLPQCQAQLHGGGGPKCQSEGGGEARR